MAGAGFKDFAAGDILTAADVDNYLMQQTVMVFDDSSARDTALTGVVAEGMFSYLKSDDTLYQYNGTAWEVAGSPEWLTNYPTNTPELAAESSGQVLMTTGGPATPVWQPMPTVNYIINGGFDIWQRGTSFAQTSGVIYGADRWGFYRGGFATGATTSRQTTTLDNFQFAARVQRDSGNTSTAGMNFTQPFETSEIIRLRGQAVTISFWARAGANYSSASSVLSSIFDAGTGTNETGWVGFTSAISYSQTNTLTTSWQRFTQTFTLANTRTSGAIRFGFNPVGTAGANDWFEITGVQVEAGSIATPFKRHAPSLQGELAACQRYYYRIVPGAAGRLFGAGFNQSTTISRIQIPFPVSMRVAPSALEQTGTAGNYRTFIKNDVAVALTSVPAFISATTDSSTVNFTSTTGWVAGEGSQGQAVTTDAYLGWSAEL
jgi:hypothetical protein